MRNFFNSILQQKRLLFFALLFFVVVGIFAPTMASAGWLDELIDAVIYAPLRGVVMLAAVIIVMPAMALKWIFKMFADMSFGLFAYILSQLIEDPQNLWAITKNTPNGAGGVFLASWDVVKGWANMLIVLGLVGIAMATILRFRDYEAKKLLIPIIIVALLVNFSVVFVGVMIDGSNIVMRTLTVGNEQEQNIILAIDRAHRNIADPLYTRAMAAATNATSFSTPIAEALRYTATESVFIIMYLAIAIIFFLLSIVLIQRYVILAILFILSPLAFVFYVFPFSKNLFSKWWHLFIKWCFAGLAAAFFIGISVKILQTPFIGNNWSTNPGDNAIGALPRIILQLLIVLGFLVAGYKFAKKSAAAADLIMGGVKATAGVLSGAVLGVAGGTTGGLAKATGLATLAQNTKNRVSDKISDWSTRAQERLGLVGAGTNATRKKSLAEARLKEPTERLKNESSGALAKIATESYKPADRVAATKILTERNDFDKVGKSKRETAMKEAMAYGIPAKEFTALDTRLAKHDEKGIKELMEDPDPNKRAKTETEAEERLVAKAYQKLTVPQIRDLEEGAIDLNFARNTTPQKLMNAGRDLSISKIDKLVELAKGDMKNRIVEIGANIKAGTATKEERKEREVLLKNRKAIIHLKRGGKVQKEDSSKGPDFKVLNNPAGSIPTTPPPSPPNNPPQPPPAAGPGPASPPNPPTPPTPSAPSAPGAPSTPPTQPNPEASQNNVAPDATIVNKGRGKGVDFVPSSKSEPSQSNIEPDATIVNKGRGKGVDFRRLAQDPAERVRQALNKGLGGAGEIPKFPIEGRRAGESAEGFSARLNQAAQEGKITQEDANELSRIAKELDSKNKRNGK